MDFPEPIRPINKYFSFQFYLDHTSFITFLIIDKFLLKLEKLKKMVKNILVIFLKPHMKNNTLYIFLQY